MTYKRKLIEVALPLEAINRESAREKSIRHGHPSTNERHRSVRPGPDFDACCQGSFYPNAVVTPPRFSEGSLTSESQVAFAAPTCLFSMARRQGLHRRHASFAGTGHRGANGEVPVNGMSFNPKAKKRKRTLGQAAPQSAGCSWRSVDSDPRA